MATIVKNTIFTNVAETSDGGVYWEGMDESLPEDVTITSWKNKPWSSEDGTSFLITYDEKLCSQRFVRYGAKYIRHYGKRDKRAGE